MNTGCLLSLVDFAKLARTNRSTLLYYEKIGILSSAKRAKNNYRLYNHVQLATMNLLHTCKYLRMKLPDIEKLCNERTPELIVSLLDMQIAKLNSEMKHISDSLKTVHNLRKTITTAMSVNIDEIVIQYVKEDVIILGKKNEYSTGKTPYDALTAFYHLCNCEYPKTGLDYSICGFFDKERVINRDFFGPDHFYIYDAAGKDVRPAALYAIGYQHGGYGQADGLYERILTYIEENGFEVCGPAYEEYPLNEICVKNENEYLIRVMITVQKKKDS